MMLTYFILLFLKRSSFLGNRNLRILITYMQAFSDIP